MWFRVLFLSGVVASWAVSTLAQEPSPSESSFVKLLKKAPSERVGPLVEMVSKRGTADDLAYLFDRATTAGAWPDALVAKTLEGLAEAAQTRDVRPTVDAPRLTRLIAANATPTRLAAIRLAGAWKLKEPVENLLAIAGARATDPSTRAAAFEALGQIGDPPARQGIEALATTGTSPTVRALAVAGLARLGVESAASKAVGALTAEARIEDVTPLMAAFLDRQGGGDRLATALGSSPLSADGARLALRAVYGLGRSDEALIAVLSKAAGLEAEARPPTPAEMEALVNEVAARGNPVRGEAIFRRAELSCMKCHALAGAGGGVGPELSSLGLSSPVDYVVNSILVPDQAIKEEYQTRTVLTVEGRVLQGIVSEEDDSRVVLKDASGELRVVPTASIEESRKGGSLMPKGLVNLLTRAEFVDLVRFLSELGKPGRYALRPIPTIQRWRVLKDVPAGEVITEILALEPSSWLTAFGQVSGELPLGDLAALTTTTEKVVYVQGEIRVSASGPVLLRFAPGSGMTRWIDDRPLPGGEEATVDLPEGLHRLTLRVDLPERKSTPVRVEVVRAPGSPAEFSVVGGR